MTGRTLYEKVYADHVVAQAAHGRDVLYIDLHLVHEVTSPQAFAVLAERGLEVRRPDRTVATMDHSIPTKRTDGKLQILDEAARSQLETLSRNCAAHGIPLHAMGEEAQGVVHVIGPELGLTQPGMTVVCGDSHTSTHGAFGALAFGIGTSQVGHVLATQTLLERRAKTFRVTFTGRAPDGVSAKDLVLAFIAKVGTGGGAGHVLEFGGEAVRALSMEGRMTLCNMSIEAGARAGMVAPDETTFAYLKGRAQAPKGADWDAAVARWSALPSDPDATFDREITLDASALTPRVTWGTNPGMGVGIDEPLPAPGDAKDATEKAAREQALAYMKMEAGKPLLGEAVDVVFIGSCTNARIEDLREAARIFRKHRVKDGTRVLVVPGSRQVKGAAEAEGLDRVFTEAGAEWRDPGCSMCIAMNGDKIEPGQLAVSTSNRNFEGRQGPGGRTILASPLTAAAAAVRGAVADPRELLR
ncbi:MAG: 3-isopropylmalate dehydratase large subunit [Sandaracinus sp.]|nr:3-isopropylmalate dehydratase large subunit [Sandaracinus sp.]